MEYLTLEFNDQDTEITHKPQTDVFFFEENIRENFKREYSQIFRVEKSHSEEWNLTKDLTKDWKLSYAFSRLIIFIL